MKRIVCTFVFATILLGGACFSGDQTAIAGSEKEASQTKNVTPEGITWLSYDEGLARANKEGKHILIDFYTTWCGWCKKMDRSTFQDDAVVDFVSNNMVAIKVNAESPKLVTHGDSQISERILSRDVFGARGFPTYFFLNPQGKALFKISGYRDATDFLQLVEYVGESHYKSTSFAAFMEAKKNSKKPTK